MKRYLNYSTVIILSLLSIITVNNYAQTPHIEYSTYIGGRSWDYGHSITVDDSGYAYIAGQANSNNYPVTISAFDRTENGSCDILVTKLNRSGSGLIYSTFIGGSGIDDTRKVFVDKTGCVFITGSTKSPNFPTTANALQGNAEGYFLKLGAQGDSLKYSSRWAGGERVLLDGEGNVIILGGTNSGSFPTTENAYCRTLAGGNDLFIAKIDINTNTIIFSTLIGGSGDEWASSMTLDSQNNIIIAGQTTSENYPEKGNTFATFNSDKSNVFVTKLKSDGTGLIYSTLVGGNDNDWPFDVAVDLNNNVFVTGGTQSGNFPISNLAFDTSYSGGQDAFLFKLSADGSRLIYSTFIGGSDKDGGRGVVVDKEGKAYVTGCTRSTNFPVTSDAFDKTYKGGGTDQWAWGDPFLLVMNPEGSQVIYSTYFGGSNDEEAYGIAMDNRGDIYLSGVTSSLNFPTTQGAYDRTLSGGGNIYVTKFSFNPQTNIKTSSVHPLKFELNQNYPNPFNPTTTINYSISKLSKVQLNIYNVLGQKIKTLVNSFQNPGEYSFLWDATDNKNNIVSSGVYIYSLVTNGVNFQKKMVLMQ